MARTTLRAASVALEEGDHLIPVEKGVRIVAVVMQSGQADHPRGKLEMKGVPAFAAPALGDAPALEHQVLSPASRQVMAHGEAGLTAADHDRVDALCHAIPLVMFIVSHG